MDTFIKLFVCAILANSQMSHSYMEIENTTNCQAFYVQYMHHAMNLTDCQLKNASPFRLCTNCLSEYTITYQAYQDFVEKDELENCREKYLHADRVQIIPTIQKNVENMWDNSQCKGCTEDVHLDPATGEVSFKVPDAVATFLLLYTNFTSCLHDHTTPMANGKLRLMGKGDNQTVCQLCKQEYMALNDHYMDMSASDDGKTEGLCMDLVDMMNYTRHNWSVEFHCSHRSGDELPVILVTLVIVVSPILFYGILKMTGKERKKEVFRQKRLTSSLAQDNSSISSYTFGAGNSMAGNRLQPVT